MLVKNISVIGYYWGAYRILEPELLKDSFAELLRWYEEGKLRPHISKIFDLPDAGAAIKALSSRQTTGKVVIKV